MAANMGQLGEEIKTQHGLFVLGSSFKQGLVTALRPHPLSHQGCLQLLIVLFAAPECWAYRQMPPPYLDKGFR